MISDCINNSNQLNEGPLDSFQCNECKKTFKYESHFKRHVQTHSDSRPFECDVCGKKFKRQDALKTHELTHSSDLPFRCSSEGCTESFASKAALRYHELRHTNETVFICDLEGCNKKFLTIGQLKQHQRTKIHQKSGNSGQYTNDLDSFFSTQNNNSFNNSGTLSHHNHNSQVKQQIKQEQINNAAPSSIQFNSPQCFYNLQNSSNLIKSRKSNLIQNFSNYLQSENVNGHTFSHNIQHKIDDSSPINSQTIKVKKEHSSDDKFIDDFSQDEQVFISEIWNTIKQEGQSNPQRENANQANINQEFNDSCNNDYYNEYPKNKRIRKNQGQNESTNSQSSGTSNLLLEFTRLNSSGYSFSRLKQELRIIVGLIDKIKKEDEEMQPSSNVLSSNNLDQCGSNNGYGHSQQSFPSIPSYQSSSIQKLSSTSLIKNDPKNHMKKEYNDKNILDKYNGDDNNQQDYYFYQKDESPFHNYECKYIHESLPKEVTGKSDNNNKNSNKYANMGNIDFQKNSDCPLLMKKIKTAVRLVQYCKKACIEQKKQQMQEKLNIIHKSYNIYNTNEINKVSSSSVDQQQSIFNERNINEIESQQYEHNSFNINNNNQYPVEYKDNMNAYSPSNSYNYFQNQLPFQNILNFNNVTNQSTSPQDNHQSQFSKEGCLQQKNNDDQSQINVNNYYKPQQPQFIQSQNFDNLQFNFENINQLIEEDSQRILYEIDSNASENVQNIFDAADELQINSALEESFQIYKYLPPEQFNNLFRQNQDYEQ